MVTGLTLLAGTCLTAWLVSAMIFPIVCKTRQLCFPLPVADKNGAVIVRVKLSLLSNSAVLWETESFIQVNNLTMMVVSVFDIFSVFLSNSCCPCLQVLTLNTLIIPKNNLFLFLISISEFVLSFQVTVLFSFYTFLFHVDNTRHKQNVVFEFFC